MNMDNNKVQIEMPCQKYIVRQIQTEEQKEEYAKNIFQHYKKYEYKETEAITSYTLSISTSKTDFTALSYRNERLKSDEFYNAVMQNNDIKEYKSCKDFCKKIDKEIINCCKVCHYNASNTNPDELLEKEYQMIHYISSSPDALNTFLKYSNASFFKSNHDIAADVYFEKPIIIPLLRICFSAIKGCGVNYYTAVVSSKSEVTNAQRERLLFLKMRIFKELKNKYESKGLGELLKINKDIFDIIWKITTDKIINTPLLSETEAIKILKNETADNKNTAIQQQETNTNTVTSEVVVNVRPPQSNENEPSDNTENTDVIMEELVPKQLEHIDENVEQQDVANLAIDKEFEPEENVPKECNQDTSEEYTILKTSGIYLPPVQKEYIMKYFQEITDENVEELYTNALNDRSASVECITDEQGELILVLWDRKNKKYYYCYFSTLHHKIKDILKSQSIVKICYQPYLLYSLSRNYDSVVCNIFSFYTLSRNIFISDMNMEYRELIEIFTEGKSYEAESYGCPVINDFIGGLPFYRQIKATMQKLLVTVEQAPSLVQQQLLEDEVFGLSYLRCNYAEEDSTLLYLYEDGKVQINEKVPTKYLREGYMIAYQVESGMDSVAEIYNMYIDILANLAKEGRFRKRQLYLITFTKGKMIIYVERKAKNLIDTIITVKIHKYGIKNQLQRMKVKKEVKKVNQR